MNAHHAVSCRVDAIDRVDLPNNVFDRTTTEFVAENIDADFLVGRPVGADRINNAINTYWAPR